MRLEINPILLAIITTTIFAGVISITIAAIFSFAFLSKIIERLVSLSVGIMLSTALLHALPEAFESSAKPNILFGVLLGGLLTFFLLEKLFILRHSHHYENDGHGHQQGHDKCQAGKAGWMILVGNGLHNFTDGILIAAAFLANSNLGLMTSLAIIVHEIPQAIGDFIILLNAGFSRVRTYIYNFICSLMTVLGGIFGYFILEKGIKWIPYVLVFASSGFIYIAVADLMPQMHRHATLQETVHQTFLIVFGVVIILLVTNYLHTHQL